MGEPCRIPHLGKVEEGRQVLPLDTGRWRARRDLLAKCRNTESGALLCDWLCWSRQISTAIEIGVFHGGSSWFLGQTLVKPATLISVEWQRQYLARIAPEMHQIEGLTWVPVAGDSTQQDYVKICTRAGVEYVDLVFHDGGHRLADVADDVLALWPVLSDRCVLVFHDYDRGDRSLPGVRRFVDRFFGRVLGWQVFHGWTIMGEYKKGFAVVQNIPAPR